MKPIIRLFFFFLSFNLFLFPLSAQIEAEKIVDPTTGTPTTTFSLVNAPLIEKTKFDTTPPYYKQTIIFGDGNFRFIETENKTKGLFSHTYGPFQSGMSVYNVRAYSHGVYSTEEDDVPDERTTVPGVDSIGTRQTEMVDSNRYIQITRQVQVKPGDPFITVLSVKNPSPVNSFRGHLAFLYNGRLTTIKKNDKVTLPDYSTFNIRENLFYQPDVLTDNELVTYHYTIQPSSSLHDKYANMLVMEINDLPPNEEVHYFIDIEGDTTMMNLFDSTEKAEMDFGLALASFPLDGQNQISVLTPDSLQNEVNALKIGSYLSNIIPNEISSDSVSSYFINVDTTVNVTDQTGTFIQSLASNVVDYYTSTATLTKSHDPNYLIMEACDCPEIADVYQIFTTIHCENTGYAETNNIFIDMKLPDGITADDVAIGPIDYHPFRGLPNTNIVFEKITSDSIRWSLIGFGIEGTPIHGVGDPRTFAEIQFNMYSTVEPSLLDSVYACVRFETLSGVSECTAPKTVSLLDAEKSVGVLTCSFGDCSDYTGSTSCCFLCIPCWAWVLIIVLLIIFLIWLYRRNN